MDSIFPPLRHICRENSNCVYAVGFYIYDAQGKLLKDFEQVKHYEKDSSRDQWEESSWLVLKEDRDYPVTAALLRLYHGGSDNNKDHWYGRYGIKMTKSSIMLGFR